MPVTSSSPSSPASIWPPARSTAARSPAGSGVRTETVATVCDSMKLSTVVSAMRLPLPMTTRSVAVWDISLMRWLE